MDRIARIANRIVVAYLEKAPRELWGDLGNGGSFRDAIVFVYDAFGTGKFAKGSISVFSAEK